jgi:CSLREA domain-containing protein
MTGRPVELHPEDLQVKEHGLEREGKLAIRAARRLGVVGVLGAMGALLLSSSALGAVIEPNTFGDENGGGGSCSLREAVLSANTDTAFGGCSAGAGPDTIPLGGGTFVLSIPPGTTGDDKIEGDLDVAGPLTITHTGLAPAVIDGNGIDRVVQVLPTGNLTASGLTIRDGRTGQSGAGIRNEGSLNISSATVTGNESTASFGGGIANTSTGTLVLTNVTISGNRAENDSGGIDQGPGGQANLNNVTITGNTADTNGNGGGGGGLVAKGTVNLRNTIIAGNKDFSEPGVGASPNCSGGPISRGNNLIADGTGCGFASRNGDQINVKPLLGPLANNGGSTFTHALLAGSPAINAGAKGDTPTDQRGVPRKAADIGAYEFARCGGRVVNRVGTSGKDKLVGTNKADGILGLGGKDILKGRAGGDGLCGGKGKDTLIGGKGKDKLKGGKGKDKLKGGPGKDVQIQ